MPENFSISFQNNDSVKNNSQNRQMFLKCKKSMQSPMSQSLPHSIPKRQNNENRWLKSQKRRNEKSWRSLINSRLVKQKLEAKKIMNNLQQINWLKWHPKPMKLQRYWKRRWQNSIRKYFWNRKTRIEVGIWF